MVAGSLIDQAGLRIGHWTDEQARTGCTVLAFERAALSAVEVRGAAPGSRELECLAPGRLEQHANAIVLTGGSAFGLATADGVVRELASRGIGYQTAAGPVPIVPAAVIFDLANGEPVSPTAEHGRLALLDSTPLPGVAQGQVGAGTGATWNKLAGSPVAGGIGIAQEQVDGYLVTAVVVLNALGAVAGVSVDPRRAVLTSDDTPLSSRETTTLISVVTDFPCDHGVLTRLCVAAHDGLARMVRPAHTLFDGDTAFATTLAEGASTPAGRLRLGIAVELAVEAAVSKAAEPGSATLGA